MVAERSKVANKREYGAFVDRERSLNWLGGTSRAAAIHWSPPAPPVCAHPQATIAAEVIAKEGMDESEQLEVAQHVGCLAGLTMVEAHEQAVKAVKRVAKAAAKKQRKEEARAKHVDMRAHCATVAL